MPSIAVPRVWQHKPAYPSPVAHPDLGANASVFLLNRSLRDIGRGGKHATLTYGSFPTTRGLECDGNNWITPDFSTGHFANIEPQNRNNPWTMVFIGCPLGVGTDIARFAVGNTLSANDSGWFFGYENRSVLSSPNKMRFFVAGDDGRTLLDTYIGTELRSGQRVICVLKTTAGGVVAFTNGIRTEDSWLLSADSGYSNRVLQIGRANFSSTTLPFHGIIECVAFLNKTPSDAWCYQASLRPYQMLLAPRRDWMFFDAVASAAPTVEALTPTTIGATSHRPRFTYTA